jgi:N12 class adenine-specific DNA methylase
MTLGFGGLRERMGHPMPVTRFSEFVNVAGLIAMDRTIADVVFKSDLRQQLRPLAGKSFAKAQIA